MTRPITIPCKPRRDLSSLCCLPLPFTITFPSTWPSGIRCRRCSGNRSYAFFALIFSATSKPPSTTCAMPGTFPVTTKMWSPF